jgi:fatty acid desaturase
MIRCFAFVDRFSRHFSRQSSTTFSGPSFRQWSGHFLRIAAPFLVMFAFPTIAPLAAIAASLGVFMLTHELAHGALGLSRRRNDLALAIAGICMATSGHAMRLLHLRHHADPLGDGDLEGRSARLPAWQALAAAPGLCVMLVVAGWRTATARDRRWQRAEYAAIAILGAVVLAVGPRALQIYLLTAVVAEALAPFWAGHLPHRTPQLLRALASRLARVGSMAMRTLVVHDEHHRRPKLPTRQLGDRELGGHRACAARLAG